VELNLKGAAGGAQIQCEKKQVSLVVCLLAIKLWVVLLAMEESKVIEQVFDELSEIVTAKGTCENGPVIFGKKFRTNINYRRAK
jgi:hypothetical protein